MAHNLIQATRLSAPIDTSAPYDPSSLAGKTILITGGAQGLGARFARHWAAHGANLAIGDINDAAGEALVAELRAAFPGGNHYYGHCDVTNWDSQAAFFAAVAARGGINVVVANAGINDPGNAWVFEDPAKEGDAPARPDTKVLDINITGVAYTTHLALFWLPRNKATSTTTTTSSGSPDRCLLLMGSVSGLTAFPGQGPYTMSKHAVTGLFRAIRGTAWRRAIRVNMLAPYFVAGTPMMPVAAEAAFLAGGPGAAVVDDVVDAGTRLVADEAIVGRALVVGPSVKEAGTGGEKMAVWECYAEDYVTAETFVWRWIRMLNAVEKAKGWVGWAGDVVRIVLRR